jgi:hypothetical protein
VLEFVNFDNTMQFNTYKMSHFFQPDSNHIVGRLMQIRGYIKQASDMKQSLVAAAGDSVSIEAVCSLLGFCLRNGTIVCFSPFVLGLGTGMTLFCLLNSP